MGIGSSRDSPWVTANSTVSGEARMDVLNRLGRIDVSALQKLTRMVGIENGVTGLASGAVDAKAVATLKVAEKLQRMGIIENGAFTVRAAERLESIVGMQRGAISSNVDIMRTLREITGINMPVLKSLCKVRVSDNHITVATNFGGGAFCVALILTFFNNMHSADKVALVGILMNGFLAAAAAFCLALIAANMRGEPPQLPASHPAAITVKTSSVPTTRRMSSTNQQPAPQRRPTQQLTQPRRGGGWRFFLGCDDYGNDIVGPKWQTPLEQLAHIKAIARRTDATNGAVAFNSIGCIKRSARPRQVQPGGALHKDCSKYAPPGLFLKDDAVPSGWIFFPNYDSFGNDICHRDNPRNVWEIVDHISLNHPNAVAFNTLGYIKEQLVSVYDMQTNFSHNWNGGDQGLYVKY